jgi:hypothetical protein
VEDATGLPLEKQCQHAVFHCLRDGWAFRKMILDKD